MSQSTAMVMSGWSVHQPHFFPGQARLNSTLCTFLNQRKEENDRRNYFTTKLYESMGSNSRPRICSRTRYGLLCLGGGGGGGGGGEAIRIGLSITYFKGSQVAFLN